MCVGGNLTEFFPIEVQLYQILKPSRISIEIIQFLANLLQGLLRQPDGNFLRHPSRVERKLTKTSGMFEQPKHICPASLTAPLSAISCRLINLSPPQWNKDRQALKPVVRP